MAFHIIHGNSVWADIAPHRHSINVLLEEERPTPGRPPGSHSLILTTPAHTKTRICHCPLRGLCKGEGRVVRSGDPCGRPGVGLWQLNFMPIALSSFD